MTPFYSRDRLSHSRNDGSLRLGQRSVAAESTLRTHSAVLPRQLEEQLWSLSPSLTGHVPGVLKLCHGLPVMLKHNEATELCATNGAEGVVVGWDAEDMENGEKHLTTLFVKLIAPTHDVTLPGLPVNVVLITAMSDCIVCMLPNDKTRTILREQVHVLPNFAMTDYGSQGRTRRFNVVDLKYCRSHQSVYTCLSRGSSLKDTVIMQDFDENKIMGGMSFDLRKEFRTLEILDDITRLKFDGQLPHTINGQLRIELTSSYMKWMGSSHVPDTVHPALNWEREGAPWPSSYSGESFSVQDTTEDDGEGRPVKRRRLYHPTQIDDPEPSLPPSFLLPSGPLDLREGFYALDTLLTVIWNRRETFISNSHVASSLTHDVIEIFRSMASSIERGGTTLEDLHSSLVQELHRPQLP